MPLTGTGPVLAAARKAAKAAVTKKWSDMDKVLSAAEVQQLKDELEEADSAAIVAHIVTSAAVVVASVSGVTTGGGVSGPGTGTVT